MKEKNFTTDNTNNTDKKNVNSSESSVKSVPSVVTPSSWKITITSDERSTWCFSYRGKLSTWQVFCITLAGWKIERLKN